MMFHARSGSTRRWFRQAKRLFSTPFRRSIVLLVLPWAQLNPSSAALFGMEKGVISQGKTGSLSGFLHHGLTLAISPHSWL